MELHSYEPTEERVAIMKLLTEALQGMNAAGTLIAQARSDAAEAARLLDAAGYADRAAKVGMLDFREASHKTLGGAQQVAANRSLMAQIWSEEDAATQAA